MRNKKELLERLKSLKKWKKSKSFYAKELDITVEEVTKLVTELKALESEEYGSSITGEEERVTKINTEKGTFESEVVSSFEPKSDKELAELHRVDTTKYKISSYWTKQKGDKFTSSLLCTLIKPTEFDPEKFAEFIKGYKPPKVKVEISKSKESFKETVNMELSLYDFHIDKLTVQEEPIEERVRQYKQILQDLVNQVTKGYHVDTLAFVISNDFFHTDNIHNQTTSGTQLTTSTTWDKAYEIGFDLMVWAITVLKENCNNLEVILVSGNHDRTKSFYLAHALEMFFKGEENVFFDRSFDSIKYTVLGNTFIGYHHGNCKIEDLPLIFATDRDSSMEFGASTYREVHVGDKHYYLTKEVKGVRIQQIPSLSATDRWHKDMNYVNNVRAALALVYHPVKGKIAEFEERIQ